MSPELIAGIPGATELASWFGRFPRFHDANVLDFILRGDGSGHIHLKGWRMTDKVDERGYFILDTHFTATFFFEGVTRAELGDFMPGCAIVSDLRIQLDDNGYEIVMESSYGFDGMIRAQSLRVEFQPEPPQ